MIGRVLGFAGVLIAVFASQTACAQDLSLADRAWIDKCISDRAAEKLDPIKLRSCACMQQIVEENEPFTVTELGLSYPPAHVMCKEEAGMLP